jgi:hypothetical protein
MDAQTPNRIELPDAVDVAWVPVAYTPCTVAEADVLPDRSAVVVMIDRHDARGVRVGYDVRLGRIEGDAVALTGERRRIARRRVLVLGLAQEAAPGL